MSFQLKMSRFDLIKTGGFVAVALGLILDKSNSQISAIQFYVKGQECVNERGSLVITDCMGGFDSCLRTSLGSTEGYQNLCQPQ